MTTKATTALKPETPSSLVIEAPEMLDRIVALSHASRALETVTIELPEAIHGLPKAITALVKHSPTGPVIEGTRALFAPHATAPERRKGTAKTTTLLSFIHLVNRHKDPATSAIFAKTAWPEPQLIAVLDYYTVAHEARYCEHRVEYVFPLTDEFKAWMKMDGETMKQTDFATFLEEHVDELTAPMDTEKMQYERLFNERIATPMEIVTLSRDLEIHVGQKVKRKERLQTGERTIVFESEHTTASGEAVDIPGIFMISVSAFVDGDPIRLPARLRYRISGGDLLWFYQLYRPEFWLRAQVQNDLLEAATATGLPAFEGAPER